MKKALSFALVLLLVTGLFAGGGKEETSSSINKSLINELFNIDVTVNLYF